MFENNGEECFCTCARNVKLIVSVEQLLRTTYERLIGSPNVFSKFIFHNLCPCSYSCNPLNIIITFAQIQDSSLWTSTENKDFKKMKTFWKEWRIFFHWTMMKLLWSSQFHLALITKTRREVNKPKFSRQ